MNRPAIETPRRRIDRVHDWLRASASGLIALAIVIGAGAGAGAVVFRRLVVWFTWLSTGRSDYTRSLHTASAHFPALGVWFLLLVPVIGGLVYGPLVSRFAPEARGHGVPEVMLAVAEQGGRITPQVAVVKSLASAMCIGTGGSVGREGPIVQIASALGSTLGRIVRVPESRLRLLVACGAAGGISATFNAPIAGVFFALELILRDFETESFGAVVLASVTAAVIGRAAFGDHPFLALPTFHVRSPAEFGLYAALGVLAAGAGVVFTRTLYRFEDVVDKIWRWPEWLRPAVGGIALGGLLVALPEMYGVGYPVLERGIDGRYAVGFLVVLLFGKIIATSLTIAIGGSGGVFAPSLFMGAMLGTAFGDGVSNVFPHLAAHAGAYGLVGMGAVFAGAARAPITAVLIIFELTGDYSIILPLMTAVVLATAVSSRLSKDSIYTLKLRRRGIDLVRGRAVNLMEIITVADAMQELPETLDSEATLDEVIDRLATSGREALPVVDEAGAYRGVVTAQETQQTVEGNALDVTAGEIARALPMLSTASSLHEAVRVLAGHEASGLPVSGGDAQVVGWLNLRDVLSAYAARLRAGAQLAAADAPIPGAPVRPRTPAVHPTLARRRAAAKPPEPLRGYRVVDLELADDEPPAGLAVTDVDWPVASHVLALRRDGVPVAITPETVLSRGDRLTLLVRAGEVDDIADLLRNRAPRAS